MRTAFSRPSRSAGSRIGRLTAPEGGGGVQGSVREGRGGGASGGGEVGGQGGERGKGKGGGGRGGGKRNGKRFAGSLPRVSGRRHDRYRRCRMRTAFSKPSRSAGSRIGRLTEPEDGLWFQGRV
ncbi:unnamed protein product [Closterium sp. NIES-53]